MSDQRFGTVQKYTSRPSGAWHGRWCYRDAADRKEAEEVSDVVLRRLASGSATTALTPPAPRRAGR